MNRVRGRERKQASRIGFNATPLVDMIFTLAIFFMLVSRFSSAEQVPMQLPKPDKSKAEVVKLPTRAIINCRPADASDPMGGRVLFSIGPNRPESLSVISDRLAVMKRNAPGLQVVVRADKRLPYADVRAVMRLVADQNIEMLNVVAHVAEVE